VVERLLAEFQAPWLFDRRRARQAFERLVTAGVPEALKHAVRRLDDENLAIGERVPEIVALIAAGEAKGVQVAQRLLSSESLSPADGASILEALLGSGREYALAELVERLRRSSSEAESVTILNCIPIEDAAARRLLIEKISSESLVRPWVLPTVTLLAEFGHLSARALLSATEASEVLALSTRATIFRVLIALGHLGAVSSGERLLDDPGLPRNEKADLAIELVPHSIHAVDTALKLISSREVDWHRRRNLCRSLARAARDSLRARAQEPMDWWLKVRMVCALVETGDSWAIAAAREMVVDKGGATPLLTRLATVVLSQMAHDSDALVATAQGLLRDPNRIIDWAWEELLCQVFRLGGALKSEELDLDKALSAATLRQLVECGPEGQSLVFDFALDDRRRLGARMQACVALIAYGGGSDSITSCLLIEESLAPIRDRILIALASIGASVALQPIVDLVPVSPAAYQALHGLLGAGVLSRGQVDHAIAAAGDVKAIDLHSLLPSDPRDALLRLNESTLDAYGIEYSSSAAATAMLGLARDRIQYRLGRELTELMVAEEMGQFESLGESDRLEWLLTWFPSYRRIVSAQIEVVFRELAAQVSDVVPGEATSFSDPLHQVASATKVLREWVAYGHTGMWEESLEFLYSHEQVLASDAASGVLRLAAGITPSWPIYEAHCYLLSRLRARPKDRITVADLSQASLSESVRDLIDRGQSSVAFLCGSLMYLQRPKDEVACFYAALAAAGRGMAQLAVRIMAECVVNAPSADQIADALCTLDREASRGFLSKDLQDRLKTVLSQGGDEHPDQREVLMINPKRSA